MCYVTLITVLYLLQRVISCNTVNDMLYILSLSICWIPLSLAWQLVNLTWIWIVIIITLSAFSWSSLLRTLYQLCYLSLPFSFLHTDISIQYIIFGLFENRALLLSPLPSSLFLLSLSFLRLTGLKPCSRPYTADPWLMVPVYGPRTLWVTLNIQPSFFQFFLLPLSR